MIHAETTSIPTEVLAATLAFLGVLATALFGFLAARSHSRAARDASGADYLRAAVEEWKEHARSAKADAAEAKALAAEAKDKTDRLRGIVHAWATWGEWLHDEWPTIRQRSTAPELPVEDADDSSAVKIRPRRWR